MFNCTQTKLTLDTIKAQRASLQTELTWDYFEFKLIHVLLVVAK